MRPSKYQIKKKFQETCEKVNNGEINNGILSNATPDRSATIWSDRFFNFDDQTWHPEISREEFTQIARKFKHQWPHCPFSANWLMTDFLQRV